MKRKDKWKKLREIRKARGTKKKRKKDSVTNYTRKEEEEKKKYNEG